MAPKLFTIQDVKERLFEVADYVRDHYQVQALYLFGSVAHGDNSAQSDLDFFVEYKSDARVGLMALSGLRIYLEDLFGVKVDLGTKRSLREGLREEVLAEAVRII